MVNGFVKKLGSGQPAAGAQQGSPYLPPGPEPLVFEKFQGIKTSTSRPGVPDDAMWWCDGWLTIGPRALRTLPGAGPVIFTAPAGTTIFLFVAVNIGGTPFLLVFPSDGSVWSVNTATAVSLQIAPAGTMGDTDQRNIGVTQTANRYALIVSRKIVNGYFIWDGTTFFKPGDSFGGGTIPTAINGSAIEVYQSRVWIINGPLCTFSAPGSLIDFSGASGGGSFTSADSFLQVQFTRLLQTNGFLYMIADSSINYISNVVTSGSPPVTTFTNQNADPEVGSLWPYTVEVFGRNIILANPVGAHVSYGAAVTKISEDLDGVYGSVTAFDSSFVPSAAKAVIYGKKVWMLLLPIIDPFTLQQANKLFLWNNKTWVASEQDFDLTFINYQEVYSNLTAYGTDGTTIRALFQDFSAEFPKVVQSRLWDNPVGYQEVHATNRVWMLLQHFHVGLTDNTNTVDNELGLNSDASKTVTITGGLATWHTANGSIVTWESGCNEEALWRISNAGNIDVIEPQNIAQQGTLLGLTLETESSDLMLISSMLSPIPVGYRG